MGADRVSECEHIVLSRRFVEGREGEVQFCLDCDANDPLYPEETGDLHPRGPDNARMKAWWQGRGYRFEGDPGEPLTLVEYIQAEMITGMENHVDREMQVVLYGDGSPEWSIGEPPAELTGLFDTPGITLLDRSGFQVDPEPPTLVVDGLADWAVRGRS